MEQMSKLPSDMNFFTQITMEAAEDRILDAMKKRCIKARCRHQSVTPEGLKDVYWDLTYGDAPAERLQNSRNAASMRCSFISGWERLQGHVRSTAKLAHKADVTLA